MLPLFLLFFDFFFLGSWKATKAQHRKYYTHAMIKLTELKDINKDNVIFEEQETGSKYDIHIKIKAKHACGGMGPLVIVSPFLSSYLQQNFSVDGDINPFRPNVTYV